MQNNHALKLQNTMSVKILAEKLNNLSKVRKFSDEDHDEAWYLADAFRDLEKSFYAILTEGIPKITQDKITEDELYDILLEIGEEFRHIMYHISSSKFYDYLVE